ncbi:hypothetical protein GCM10010270_84160 [Streptomyces violaceus]|nr:hypothetical protein GCM10010270_84160 [Streptomyces janthinus]
MQGALSDRHGTFLSAAALARPTLGADRAVGTPGVSASSPFRSGFEKRGLRSGPSVDVMTSIASVTLEVADPTAAERFLTTAFGLGGQVRLRASEAPSTGFRGFTLSLVVSQPANVDALVDAAVDAGAAILKPAAKSLWGYGGVVQAPDGTIWQVASSSKKDTGPAARQIDEIVLLLGVEDVKASKQFYADHGLAVAKSFGSKYVEFATGSGPVKLALYKRRGLAKLVGVSPDGTGSHRLTVDSDAGTFTDPDGFAWATASENASL